MNRSSSPPEVFLGKGVLKICSKFIGEHPCRSVISVKLLWRAASGILSSVETVQRGEKAYLSN